MGVHEILVFPVRRQTSLNVETGPEDGSKYSSTDNFMHSE